MRILVTGASGFVGQSLCASLHKGGYKVIAAARSENISNNNYVQKIVNSINGETDWSGTIANVDMVIHLAARVHVMNETASNPLEEFRKVNVSGALNLARQAAKSGVKRFIFVSSVKVNGESTHVGQLFRESDMPNPQDAYGISKYEAEQSLLKIAQETGMQVVIIRPPIVYGPGVKANFAKMIHMVKLGFPLPLGSINNQRSLVYVGNLVDFIMHCITHPHAANQIFMVSDGVDVSTTALLKACAKALGVETKLIPIPQKILEAMLKLVGKNMVAQRLFSNLQVDISKAQQLLGWTPPYTMEEGLLATVSGNVNNL